MRGEGGGDIRGRASQIDGDFPLEVEAGQLIEILFRNFQSVADENQRGGNIGRSAGCAGADEGIVRKRQCRGLAARNQGERGFGFVDFELIEADGLVETVRAGRLEPGFLELLDSVCLRFAETLAASVAAFEGIVGKKFDVRPSGVAVEVGRRGSLLRWGNRSKSQKKYR